MNDTVNATCDVLLVDDDQELTTTLQKVLEVEGFLVDVVGQGAEALERCHAHEPTIVVLDFELPDMSGQNVCRQLRTFTDAYIIMVTGRSSESDKIVSLSLGADDYVTKPFSYGELVARLHSLLRRPRVGGHSLAKRSFGPLTVNISSREAIVDDAVIGLTRTEFDILDALTEQAGSVIERKALLERIWSTTWSDDDHLIDVHVHNLRRKLSAAGLSKSALVTVRGVGFRFVEQP